MRQHAIRVLQYVGIAVLAPFCTFHQPWPRSFISQRRRIANHHQKGQTPSRRLSDAGRSSLWSWHCEGKNKLQRAFATPRSTNHHQEQRVKDREGKFHATVIRTAARKYNATASKPSSREYTTHKDALPSIQVTFEEGVFGDYNHYRTVALKGTPNRAISILTKNVMELLKSAYPSSQIGDLGENVWIDGVSFSQLFIGQQYKFISSSNHNKQQGVVVEITEPMVPCANLCKLAWINMAELEAKERIARCRGFMDFLDRADGFRGWYAKVLQPGVISVGDSFALAKD